MNAIHRFRLFASTVRHLSWGQIVSRAKRVLRSKWQRFIGKRFLVVHDFVLADWQSPCSSLHELVCQADVPANIEKALVRARKTTELSFNFLNQTIQFEHAPDWHLNEVGQLWRFHLHYFTYLEDLIVESQVNSKTQIATATLRSLIGSWLDSCSVIAGDAWHPHTISLRLVNWLTAARVLGDILEEEDAPFLKRLQCSIYAMARLLENEVEFDVRGNHILKNLKALIYAGIAFEGPEPSRWLGNSMDLLRSETEEQILSDGGHFERNPGYHLVVTRDYLEIGLLLRKNQLDVPGWLDYTIEKMLDFTAAIVSRDGNIPLIKDTVRGAYPSAFCLLATGNVYFEKEKWAWGDFDEVFPYLWYSADSFAQFRDVERNKGPRCDFLAASGYCVFEDESSESFLVMDVGKPCPDYLPAHAHADMLSYELDIESQRVIVDSGVYEYEKGLWRDYFRSTRAHNTVEIEGRSQSEVWDKFRVGRRARPDHVYFQESDNFAIVSCGHDGYQRLPSCAKHTRTLYWQKGDFWLILDEITGHGQTAASSFIHFHPSVSAMEMSYQQWMLEWDTDARLYLSSFGVNCYESVFGRDEDGIQGWYSEEFGKVEPNCVLELKKNATLPFCFGYVLARAPMRIEADSTVDGRHNIKVVTQKGSYSLRGGGGLRPDLLRNSAV